MLFRAFLSGYDPDGAQPPPDGGVMLAYTLLHRFGAPIIAHILPGQIRDDLSGLDELIGRLFPGFDA